MKRLQNSEEHPRTRLLDQDDLVEAIDWLATRNPAVTSEMVWSHFGISAGYARSSKLGPAFLQAAKRGIIERTDRIIYTDKTGTHAGRFVWASKIYKG